MFMFILERLFQEITKHSLQADLTKVSAKFHALVNVALCHGATRCMCTVESLNIQTNINKIIMLEVVVVPDVKNVGKKTKKKLFYILRVKAFKKHHIL